jgi:hypothetical protein
MYDREVNLPIKINIMNVRVKVIDKSDKNRIFVDAIFTNQKNLNRLLKTINDKYGKNHALENMTVQEYKHKVKRGEINPCEGISVTVEHLVCRRTKLENFEYIKNILLTEFHPQDFIKTEIPTTLIDKQKTLGLSEVTDLITDWKKDTVYCVRKFNKYNLSIVLTGTTNIGNWKYFNMELLTNKK